MRHWPKSHDDSPFASLSTAALIRRAWLFLKRALWLRCPECGVSPVFVPVHKTRSLRDWATPLDGCPRCGFAYEREDGYFLLAIWGVHYFTVTGLALIGALVIDYFFPMSFTALAWTVVGPTIVFGFLFVRHAKSIYMAIDHYFDPHVKPPKHRPG